MINNLKNYNFIGFVIAKIVELDTLCIFMACLVPELSKLKFFKMAIGSHCVMVTVLEDKFAGFDFGMDGIKHSIKDGLQLTNDLQRHVTDLEDELDDLQQYTRRDQIIIDNMPE